MESKLLIRRRFLQQTSMLLVSGAAGPILALGTARANDEITSMYGVDVLEYRPLVAEPFTWAWVGVKLAEGAVAWVGGKLLESILGMGHDFDKMIEEIIDAVRQVVRQEIERNALQEVIAQQRSVQELFRIYSVACKKDFWPEILSTSTFVTNRLKQLGFPAHHSYLNALAVQTTLVQEFLGRTSATKEVLGPILREAIEHLNSMHTAWRVWHDARYSVASETITRRFGPDGVPQETTYFYVVRDGNRLATFSDGRPWDDANITMKHIREVDWESDTYPRFVAPSVSMQDHFQTLLTDSFEDDPENPFKPICA